MREKMAVTHCSKGQAEANTGCLGTSEKACICIGLGIREPSENWILKHELELTKQRAVKKGTENAEIVQYGWNIMWYK